MAISSRPGCWSLLIPRIWSTWPKPCLKVYNQYFQWRIKLIDQNLISDMPEKERGEEEVRLKDILAKLEAGLQRIKEEKAKFDIK